MHTSLDGFVAGPNGEMDWIKVDEELFEYAKRRTDQSATALYGRVTYQMMDAYWPTAGDEPGASKHDIEHSSWYKQVNKVVLSNSLAGTTLANARVISDPIADKIRQLKRETEQEIVVFGSPGAAHSLMAENLIDEFWLFINPVLLGKGIPLFSGLRNEVKLELVESKVLGNGVQVLHYRRVEQE